MISNFVEFIEMNKQTRLSPQKNKEGSLALWRTRIMMIMYIKKVWCRHRFKINCQTVKGKNRIKTSEMYVWILKYDRSRREAQWEKEGLFHKWISRNHFPYGEKWNHIPTLTPDWLRPVRSTTLTTCNKQ